MQTVITKTSSKGNEIVVTVDGMQIIGSVDGTSAGPDAIGRYSPPVQVGAVLVAGYLRNAKIALTSGEIAQIEATVAANRVAIRRELHAPISRNQPDDLSVEMDRADSAW